VTVLIIDQRIVRDALRELLEKAGTHVIGTFGNGHDAIVGAIRLRPSVVVMDVGASLTDATQSTRDLIASLPGVKVVAISVYAERRYVTAMMEAGAVAYVSKNEPLDELRRALAIVTRGETFLSPILAAALDEHARLRKKQRSTRGDGTRSLERALTPRERDVLELLASGKSSKEIAHALQIALPTVESHRRQIADKLGLRTIAELTKYAIREGLTPLEC
jgi:two-component system, NarL family, response regulator NreC